MGIFSDHGNNTCPTPDGFQSYNVHGSAHNALLYATAACAAVTFVLSVSLILLHLARYRAPKEQRQIVRICFTPFVFAIVAFGEVADYNIAAYIDPIGDYYEAFGLCAIFLLYVQFAVPSGTFGEEMFQAVNEAAEDSSNKPSNAWPKMSWIAVFQYPVTELLSIIVQEATLSNGVYCSTSLKPKFGHLWSKIISTIGVGLCVLSIIRFYGHMKTLMKARRGLSKLFMFKVIVGLRFVQTWIFSILMNQDVLQTSNAFSYGDLTYGLESVILSGEMVIISLGFWYAYSPAEYSSNARPRESPIGLFHGVLDALNISDLLLGILRGIGLLISRGSSYKRTQDLYSGYYTSSGPGQYGPLAAGDLAQQHRSANPETSYYGYQSDHYVKPTSTPGHHQSHN